VDEAVSRLFLSSLENVHRVLLEPLLALGYALPASLAIVLPFNRALRGKFKEEQQAILLSLAGALVMAMGIGIVAGISKERYTYPALPLLAPLVGATVYGWRRGLGDWWDELIGKVLVIVPAAFLIACGVLTYRYWRRHGLDGTWLIVTAPTVAAGVWTLYQAMEKKALRASTGLVVMLALMSMIWGEYLNRERFKWSAYNAAAILRQKVGEGGKVTTWYTLWAQPELFYYAKVDVTVRREALRRPPFSGWMVYYDDPEWIKLPQASKDQLSEPIRLPIDLRGRAEGHVALLVKSKEASVK